MPYGADDRLSRTPVASEAFRMRTLVNAIMGVLSVRGRRQAGPPLPVFPDEEAARDAAFRAVHDPSAPVDWTKETLRRTPKAETALLTARFDDGEARDPFQMVAKRSGESPEAAFYTHLIGRDEPFPHAPRPYLVARVEAPLDASDASDAAAGEAGSATDGPAEPDFVVFIEQVEGRPPSTVKNAEADAQAIADMMVATHELEPADLPDARIDVEELRETLLDFRQVTPFDLLIPSELWLRLETVLNALGRSRLVADAVLRPSHGDLHPGNFTVMDDAAPMVVAIDWEDCALRPLGSDLYAYLVRSVDNERTQAFFDMIAKRYVSGAARWGATAASVEAAATVAALQRTATQMRTRRNSKTVARANARALSWLTGRLEGLLAG